MNGAETTAPGMAPDGHEVRDDPERIEVRAAGAGPDGRAVGYATLADFERAVRAGAISSSSEVRSALLTGGEWRPAGSLELFQGLYAAPQRNHLQYFRLTRVPWLTLGLVGTLVAWFYLMGPSGQRTVPEMVAAGAKAAPLMYELGQWWRLLTANLLHASPQHLWLNAFFLFNLCGLAENFYRRVDLAVLLFVSGLAAMGVSTALSSLVSSGSSGLLFGAWGAVAVFVYRNRAILPPTYRRFFTWNLLPYAVILLFAGLANPAVDNFAHLTGLISGVLVALGLQPRLVTTRPRHLPHKLVGMAAVTAALWLPSLGEPRVPLTELRLPTLGLRPLVPRHWRGGRPVVDEASERFTLDNGVGVALVVFSLREERPVDRASLEQDFRNRVIAPHLGFDSVADFRLGDSVACRAGGEPALCLDSEWQTPTGPERMRHTLLARGFYRHIVTFRAPRALADEYRPVWQALLAGVALVDPDELTAARAAVAQRPDDDAQRLRLAAALIRAGQEEPGLALLARLLEQAADPAQVAYESAGWLRLLGRDAVHGLHLARFAVEQRGADPPRLNLLVRYLSEQGEHEEALRWLSLGLRRNPGHTELIELYQQVEARALRARRFDLGRVAPDQRGRSSQQEALPNP